LICQGKIEYFTLFFKIFTKPILIHYAIASFEPCSGIAGGRVTFTASLGTAEAAGMFFHLAFFDPEIQHWSGGI